MERREALRSAMSERSSWEMGLMILTALTTLKREWFIAPAILLALVAVFRILAFLLFHDAALLVDMIVAEVVIASLLVLASKKLIETE
jgi:hypothetical protein